MQLSLNYRDYFYSWKPSEKWKLYHGDPFSDWVSLGLAQHWQQEPGGAGVQHTHAGHIGPVAAGKTKWKSN